MPGQLLSQRSAAGIHWRLCLTWQASFKGASKPLDPDEVTQQHYVDTETWNERIHVAGLLKQSQICIQLLVV